MVLELSSADKVAQANSLPALLFALLHSVLNTAARDMPHYLTSLLKILFLLYWNIKGALCLQLLSISEKDGMCITDI